MPRLIQFVCSTCCLYNTAFWVKYQLPSNWIVQRAWCNILICSVTTLMFTRNNIFFLTTQGVQISIKIPQQSSVWCLSSYQHHLRHLIYSSLKVTRKRRMISSNMSHCYFPSEYRCFVDCTTYSSKNRKGFSLQTFYGNWNIIPDDIHDA